MGTEIPGGGRRGRLYLTLHCHHQNDSCIKTGSEDSRFNVSLTSSLPKPVQFSGWKMHGCACKQCIFSPVTHLLSMLCAFWWRAFYMPVWKSRQKGLSVSNIALLLVVFKWHHGSEGVNWEWHHGSEGVNGEGQRYKAVYIQTTTFETDVDQI